MTAGKWACFLGGWYFMIAHAVEKVGQPVDPAGLACAAAFFVSAIFFALVDR